MCAPATPPGGIMATFIDSSFAPTFLPDIPSLYLMPFQSRHTPLPRIHISPSRPSTLGGSSFIGKEYRRPAPRPPDLLRKTSAKIEIVRRILHIDMDAFY